MAAFLALFFAALIAVSQAAPRPQSDLNSQQTAAGAGASAPAAAPGATAPNTGATAANPGATAANPGAATAANPGATTAANPGASTAANPGASSSALPAGSVALVIPSQLLGSLFPLAGASGSSTGGGSGSAGSPLATIISLIPTAINQERDRFGNAVQSLVQTNTAAIGDIIDSAAATGGKFFSNDVRLVAAWPAFFGNLLG